jgi:RNA polymerase sigma-70 factor (ECF subfamily)
VPDFADEVTQRLADTEELAATQKALSKMRRGEREVFTLCVWEGLDAATAAEALGVAVGTVRARLSRARRRLRKLTELELDGGAGGVGRASRTDSTDGTDRVNGRSGSRGTEGGLGQSGVQRPAAVGQSLGSRHQAARSTQEKKR